jgi:hypothetical protein
MCESRHTNVMHYNKVNASQLCYTERQQGLASTRKKGNRMSLLILALVATLLVASYVTPLTASEEVDPSVEFDQIA